jgi:hypothetical protein
MPPDSPTGLYWSIRGEVACRLHAPDEDNPRWAAEGWEAIPPSSGRMRYQCQHCAADGRAIGHQDHVATAQILPRETS